MAFRYKPRRKRVMRKKRYLKKRRSPMMRKKGGLTLLRKLPEISIHNTGSGTVAVTGSVSNAVLLGVPTQSVGATGTTSYDVPFSMRFSLNQIINHTDITNLCDKYRIAGAYIRFYNNKTGASINSTGGYACMQYITDHDDALVPIVSSLREKMGVKFKTFNNASSYIGVKCRPVPAREVFNTGITSGYEVPKYAPYLDCANDTIEHYGIKGVISNFNLPATANTELIKVDIALLIQAKDFQ